MPPTISDPMPARVSDPILRCKLEGVVERRRRLTRVLVMAASRSKRSAASSRASSCITSWHHHGMHAETGDCFHRNTLNEMLTLVLAADAESGEEKWERELVERLFRRVACLPSGFLQAKKSRIDAAGQKRARGAAACGAAAA
eukprot:2923866-Rhodomonas_salina.1